VSLGLSGDGRRNISGDFQVLGVAWLGADPDPGRLRHGSLHNQPWAQIS